MDYIRISLLLSFLYVSQFNHQYLIFFRNGKSGSQSPVNAGLNPPDNTFQIAGSDAGGLDNPFDLVRVTSPVTIGNLSVGEYMRKLNWEDKNMVKRLESSLRDGLHYMFCANTGQRRIPIQVLVEQISKD